MLILRSVLVHVEFSLKCVIVAWASINELPHDRHSYGNALWTFFKWLINTSTESCNFTAILDHKLQINFLVWLKKSLKVRLLLYLNERTTQQWLEHGRGLYYQSDTVN